MTSLFSIAVRVTLVSLVMTGIFYPLVVTGLAQLFFSSKANGSLVVNESGKVVGSELIGQDFASPSYFQPRPSAAGTGYDATASSGTNLGPTSKKLRDFATAAAARVRAENAQSARQVPSELVTSSASGLDPHLSPEAALWQLPRVAFSRHVTVDRIKTLLDAETEARALGFLGEPRVNVLLLNLALDRQFGAPAKSN